MGEASLWTFISSAGYVVKAVMLILLAASMASWTIIFQRYFQVRKIRDAIKSFESKFWSGIDMQSFFNQMISRNENQPGLAKIFEAGFKEYQRLNQQTHIDRDTILQGTQRAMRVAQTQQIDALEKNLSFLATVGSISPYIGLFGTVWGIMTSFQALGTVQQATIAMVAPGISEALIATAIGLFAAIPAGVAYNMFNNVIDGIANQFQNFQDELSGVLQHRLIEEGE